MLLKLYLLFCVSTVMGDYINPETIKEFMTSTPLHVQLRTPSPQAWTPETQPEKFVTNEPYHGAFPLQEACSENRLELKIGDTGTIKSPHYPRNYDSNLACEWKLQSTPGTRIELVFFDVYTQPHFFTYFDYIMVAKDGDFAKVDRMSGDLNGRTPIVIRSEKNVIGIRLRTSMFINYSGFKAQYVVISDPTAAEMPKSYQKNVFDGFCGQAATPSLATTTEATTTYLPADVPYVSDPNKHDHDTPEKIYNGTEALPNAYPWMAALLIDNKFFCGGSLIDDQHVITAAHCTHRANTIQILVGAHDITNIRDDGRKLLNVTRANIFQHPEYNENTVSHDISIIRLVEKVVFTDNIKPICLPNRQYLSRLYIDELVRITGWGKTRDADVGISPVLHEAEIKIMENSYCRTLFRGIITGNTICVSPLRGAAPCRGDSGGPLMIKQKSRYGPFYTQIGIVSFGALTCEKGLPVSVTRITAFLDYINQITGKEL